MQNLKNIPPLKKENEAPSQEEDQPSLTQTQTTQTLRLIKEQQDLTKITIKDQTDLLASKSGQFFISRTKDNKILDSALLELKKLRKFALSEKIERPLKLKKPLQEKELKKITTTKQLKNLLKQKA